MLRSDARQNISIRLLSKDHERGQREGNVNIAEDISPPPATIKKEETLSDFLYGRTPHRNF